MKKLITRSPTDHIHSTFIGSSVIKWVTKSRLLGMTVDEKLTWLPHLLDLKKSFARKLDLIKSLRSRFLPRSIYQDLYSKVILPSVTYRLILLGSCCNSDIFQFLEQAQWSTLFFHYKSAFFYLHV